MSNIQVIDAPCGAGKTTWSIQQINANKSASYIYCTPFLDEIDRIRDACGKWRFAEPLPYNGSKIDNFNELLANGGDIAVTHTTFLNATTETLELVRTGEYTLIIDEALEAVTNFNEAQTVSNDIRQTVSKEDIRSLIDDGIIEIQDDKRVVWCGKEYEKEYKFYEVQRYAKLNRLYCVDEKLFLMVFPPEMFECFKQVYIMTYMFSGSMFRYYLDLFHLGYEMKSISQDNGGYRIVDYKEGYDHAFRKQCKELIHICDNDNMNRYKGNQLSASWYRDGEKDDRLDGLRNNVSNYFRRYLKKKGVRCKDIMWTCYGRYADKVKGSGYTATRKLDPKESKLPDKQREKIEKQLACFVSCNAKATNNYQDRWALAYCVNMHYDPLTRKFFTQGGIYPDNDMFALSCMIQWIFRSRIRKGEPIEIYIPNSRMRGLLISWLDGKI